MVVEKERLRKALVDCGAVQFGRFVLASGKESGYYVNMKMALTDPKVLRMVAKAASELVQDADRLAGVELGAIPLVTAVALETGIPYVMIRKERKGYGTGKLIEGPLEKGDKVVVLEDVTTTGRSPLKAVRAIEEEGGEVLRTVVIVDRQEGAADLFEEEGVEFVAVLLRDDLK